MSTARERALALLILAATWWAYAPCLQGSFIWDDNSYVAYNLLLHDISGLWRIWFEPTATPQYHPLVFTSYWLEYQLWGADPTGYHIVNVGLHCANAWVLWHVMRRLAVPGALLTAGIFALHPVHVESVAWISERKDVLAGLFYGSSVWLWLRFLARGRWTDGVGTLLLATLTLLAKTVFCTLPLALGLIAWWRAPHSWRRWVLLLLPLFSLAGVIAWVTIWREHSHGNPALAYSLLERLLIAGRAVWTHVGLLFWPADLTLVYDRWPVSISDVRAYVFPLAGLAVVFAVIAARPRFGDGVLVGVGFFLLTLAPMLGFIDYNIMRYAFVADHFQYIAGIGLIASISALFVHCTAALSVVTRGCLSLILLASLAVLTRQQSALWVDADTIWRDNVQKNPRSWTGYTYLSTELMRQDRFADAAGILRQAIEQMPEHGEAQRTLGVVEASLGNSHESLYWLRRARHSDPQSARIANSLGLILLSLGQVDDAAVEFRSAVELDPRFAEAWHSLGLSERAKGRTAEARRCFDEALRLRPEFAEARADREALP